jgi:hypothetical protein
VVSQTITPPQLAVNQLIKSTKKSAKKLNMLMGVFGQMVHFDYPNLDPNIDATQNKLFLNVIAS